MKKINYLRMGGKEISIVIAYGIIIDQVMLENTLIILPNGVKKLDGYDEVFFYGSNYIEHWCDNGTFTMDPSKLCMTDGIQSFVKKYFPYEKPKLIHYTVFGN